MQDVIQSFVAADLLQSHNIQRLLHDHDTALVASAIATDRTRVGFSEIEAKRTIDNAFFDAHDSLGQPTRQIGRAAQDEER